MKRMFIGLLLMSSHMTADVFAEMPQTPTAEELCEKSNLIVMVELISGKTSKETMLIYEPVKYGLYRFKIIRTLKGDIESGELNVRLLERTNKGCYQKAEYVKGQRYLLYLNAENHENKAHAVYERINAIWDEDVWSKAKEAEIKSEVKFLSDPDRFKKPDDCINYKIPDEAQEKEVELTRYQKRENYSSNLEYWLNDNLVGTKSIYDNGQICVVRPRKNGMRHGKARGWYRDGKPFSIRPYRKDRLHGILMQWNKEGEIKLSYFIRGTYVKREEYVRECLTNMTLEKIDKQHETPDNFILPMPRAETEEYSVRSGDDLHMISIMWGVSVEELRDANNLKQGDVVKPDQLIRIPITPPDGE